MREEFKTIKIKQSSWKLLKEIAAITQEKQYVIIERLLKAEKKVNRK